MAKWYVAAKKADFNGIGQRFSISPVLARVIRNRDIEGDEAIEKYLHGTNGTAIVTKNAAGTVTA